jgi:DNA mismatch endonuclease (patch repair protein)
MSLWPGNSANERTTFGGLSRGKLMSRIRSTGNSTTEQRLVLLLRRAGLRGWRRHLPISGHPDFVWPECKVAVFVDGCFWHGHNCGKNLTPKTNADAWREKIARNKTRDRLSTRCLRKRGWKVLRLWECQLSGYPARCIAKISRLLAHNSPLIDSDG